MASYMSDYTLSLAADHATDRTIQLRAHSASPGNSGTDNRIGAASVDVGAAGWSAAAAGSSDIDANAEFGVLDSGGDNTVTHISKWAGVNFMGWSTMAADVVVDQNEEFTLNAGQVAFQFERKP